MLSGRDRLRIGEGGQGFVALSGQQQAF